MIRGSNVTRPSHQRTEVRRGDTDHKTKAHREETVSYTHLDVYKRQNGTEHVQLRLPDAHLDRQIEGVVHGIPAKRRVMISVIMPAYNAERHIVEAITSVLAQEHHDLELIVVDNNSRDGTVQLIEGFTDPRICLLYTSRCV